LDELGLKFLEIYLSWSGLVRFGQRWPVNFIAELAVFSVGHHWSVNQKTEKHVANISQQRPCIFKAEPTVAKLGSHWSIF
jgi:hypothetical protein